MKELDKALAVRDKSEALGTFLDWCEDQGITLCKKGAATESNEYQYHMPLNVSVNQLLATYFEIDLEKINQEQEKLLTELRGGKKT